MFKEKSVVSHIQRMGCQPGKTTLLVGGGDSFLFIYFIFFTCIGIPIYVGYFVCDSASEFGAMGSTSFLGVFLP